MVAELDERAGPRRRSAFIAELIRRALDDERRWDDIEAAMGALRDSGHDWDDDAAGWVRAHVAPTPAEPADGLPDSFSTRLSSSMRWDTDRRHGKC